MVAKEQQGMPMEKFLEKMCALKAALNQSLVELEELSMAKIGMSQNNDQEEMNLQNRQSGRIQQELAELKHAGELDWEELVKNYEKTYKALRRSQYYSPSKD